MSVVEAEFGMSNATVNLMNVCKRFGKSKTVLDFNITQKALYLLAAPSTEPEVIEAAIEKAAAIWRQGRIEQAPANR